MSLAGRRLPGASGAFSRHVSKVLLCVYAPFRAITFQFTILLFPAVPLIVTFAFVVWIHSCGVACVVDCNEMK